MFPSRNRRRPVTSMCSSNSRPRGGMTTLDLAGNRGQAYHRNPPAAVRSRWWRRATTCVIIVIGVMFLRAPMAATEPVDPATVPQSLRQYVPNSAEWLASPWMTSSSCSDHGGDWSIYVTSLIKDLPDLLAFFQPEFAGTNDAEAGPRKEFLLQKFRDMPANVAVPAGYCVEAVKKWATPDSQFQPFGFEWGNATISEHGVGLRPGCGQVRPDSLAPCRGFYISCDGATSQQEEQACQVWNIFSDEYVKQIHSITTQAYTQHPVTLRCDHDCDPVPDVIMDVIEAPVDMVQDFINWAAKKGMEQVVSFIVSGAFHLWGVFTRIAVEYSTPNLSGNSFASVYNLVAGIALALAFLGWLLSLATSWKRGHLQYALFGGIKAVVGVTLAGVGAILMVQLANECTTALISASGGLTRQADFTTSLLKANPLVAILAGLLIGVSLIFSIIFLVISSALVLMWALFGSIAAAGQVHSVSAGWLWKWAGRGTALAWAPFFMVAVMLLAQVMLLPLDPGDDPVRQVVDVGQGVALCLLLMLCPWLLWELVDFVGDRVGGPAASGGTASRAASTGTRRGSSMTGSAVKTAVTTMASTAAEIGRGWKEAGQGRTGGSGGSGSTSTPRPETNRDPRAGGPTSGASPELGQVPGQVTSLGSGGGSDGIPPATAPANLGRVVAGSQPSAPHPAAPTRGSSQPSTASSPTQPPPPP